MNKQLNLDGDVSAIIDPRLGSKYPLHEYSEAIDIAVQCTRYDKNDRPKMQVSIHAHIHTHTDLYIFTHICNYTCLLTKLSVCGELLIPVCSSKFGADPEQAATSCRAHDCATSSIPHFSSSWQCTRSNHKQPEWHQNNIWFGSGTTLMVMVMHACMHKCMYVCIVRTEACKCCIVYMYVICMYECVYASWTYTIHHDCWWNLKRPMA